MSDEKLEQVLKNIFSTPVVAKRAATGETMRKAYVPETRAVDESRREITFVASTETPDRYSDVLKVSGWELENYRRNPVVLFAHDSRSAPVGRTVEIHTEKSPVPALVHTVRFADAATYPFADQVYRLVKGKFLNSVSVGFRPLEPPERRLDAEGNWTGGHVFPRSELLEISVVPIPAQPDAVARAVGAGLVAEKDVDRFFLTDDADRPATETDAAVLMDKYARLEESFERCCERRPEFGVLRLKISQLGVRCAQLADTIRAQQEIRSVGELERLLRL